MMLRVKSIANQLNNRTFKNFGHKRQSTPGITMLWHGFLTCTFIGLGIEWRRIKKFLFEDTEHGIEQPPIVNQGKSEPM